VDFLVRNKFWLALGVLVLAAAVAFGAVFIPARSRNASRISDMKEKAAAVAEYASTGKVVNELWIAQEEELARNWQGEVEATREYLRERDSIIEQYFRAPDEPEREDLLESGTWKLVYKANIGKLREYVTKTFPVVGRRPVVEKEYGDIWLEPEDMRVEEKKYWIQKYAIEAIGALNEVEGKEIVPIYGAFEFLTQPERLLDGSHGTVFKPIPFRMVLSTSFSNVGRVQAALRRSKIAVEITGLEIERSQDAGKTVFRGEIGGGSREGPERRGEERRESSVPYGTRELPSHVMESLMREYQGNIPPEILDEVRRSYFGMSEGAASEDRRAPAAREAPGEEDVDVHLPDGLVDVTIRGYVLDYVQQEEGPAEEIEEY